MSFRVLTDRQVYCTPYKAGDKNSKESICASTLQKPKLLLISASKFYLESKLEIFIKNMPSKK
jgi:hypothetical protein